MDGGRQGSADDFPPVSSCAIESLAWLGLIKPWLARRDAPVPQSDFVFTKAGGGAQ